MRIRIPLALVLLSLLAGPPAHAADWPTWRHDAQRSAVTSALPEALHLQWRRTLAAPSSAWPASQEKLQFDASYEPIVVGKRLFVGSMVRDRVTAYDTATGKELWRFYADGPVRFAPTAWKDRLFVVSDDGFLYCLRQADGTLVWKVRGAPDARKVIGNGRLVSMWPARGAPVVADGVVYFAAGIWPFMGTFVYALDAETGKERWCNSRSGQIWRTQPHSGAVSFSAVAPQGYLTLAPAEGSQAAKLIVPNGRATPAVFDATTGAMEFFSYDKRKGGYDVAAAPGVYVNRGTVFSLDKGALLADLSATIAGRDSLIGVQNGNLVGVRLPYEVKTITTKDRRGRKVKAKKAVFESLFKVPVPLTKAYLRAGDRIYGAKAGAVLAVTAPGPNAAKANVTWQAAVPGKVTQMIAADDRLFVVTAEGDLLCYGSEKPSAAKTYAYVPAGMSPRVGLATMEVDRGYVIVFDPPGVGVLDAYLTPNAVQRLVVVHSSAAELLRTRTRLDALGHLGTRADVVAGTVATLRLPQYLAGLIKTDAASGDRLIADGQALRGLLNALVPYGGRAVLLCTKGRENDLLAAVRSAGVSGVTGRAVLFGGDGAVLAARPGVRVRRSREGRVTLEPYGGLPGSAPWTHQYGDAANTGISQDTLVKAPLGLLWFGGPSNDKILPRHGHGPSPQVVGGRLFIEGPDILRAVDVYTGALLWEKSLPGLGKYYDNTAHQPGAGGIGSNYVSLADGVYVAYGTKCLHLDPTSGKALKEFALPKVGGAQPRWGYIGAAGDVLLGGAAPLDIRGTYDKKKKTYSSVNVAENARYAVASKYLVAMDRHTGKVLWQREAEQNFRHNAIAIAAGKVFCLDKLSGPRADMLRRRGKTAPHAPRLLALDLKTGKVVWQTDKDVFGTWLSYSAEHDLLLQAGSKFRDREPDETGQGMIAYRGATGKVIWRDLKAKYPGPPLLWTDRIICQGPAFELLTGKPATRRSAVTGATHQWDFTRTYGCNTAIGAVHMLTFRSGAAGYYDLLRDGGTGNFGGFKSSCTSNLIAADGVLNAPDYTRTCTCAYQNQASLALISMPDVETWTFSSYGWHGRPVRRIGLNFGAPGDRKADSGTLWVDCPSVGGRSPDVPVAVEPKTATPFCHHSLRMHGGELKWVAASGLDGVRAITVGLVGEKHEAPKRSFTVRLVFAEMNDHVAAGQRVFDVTVGGKTAAKSLDIAKAAGGPRRTLIREVRGVEATKSLRIELTPASSSKRPPCISGVEIVAE